MSNIKIVKSESLNFSPLSCSKSHHLATEKKGGFEGRTLSRVQNKFYENALNKMKSKEEKISHPLSERNIIPLNAEQALIQLKVHFPEILSAPREYLEEAIKVLKISLPIATVLVAALSIYNGKVPIEFYSVVSGGVAGAVTAVAVRNVSQEARDTFEYENDIERARHILQSKPFKGALIGTAALGLVVSTGSFLLSSLPIFIAGVGARYGIERLHQAGYITKENKENLQMTTTIASSAFALISPIKSITSLVVGGFLGGLVEAHLPDQEGKLLDEKVKAGA